MVSLKWRDGEQSARPSPLTVECLLLSLRFGQGRRFFAQQFTFQFQPMRAVQKPIQQGVRHDRFLDDFIMPPLAID